MISPEIEPRLFAAFAAKCSELKCQCIAVGGVEDHVHLLVRCSPDVSLSNLVGQLKGSSSHLINHEILEGGGFRWQGCYGAFSVSKRSVRPLSEYILGQKSHHGGGRIFSELERCQAARAEAACNGCEGDLRRLGNSEVPFLAHGGGLGKTPTG